MTAQQKFALLLDLALELRHRGSWAGETHVQKAAYILQALLGIDTGFRFVLYKHGPFSFELHDALAQMEAERFIAFEEQPYPYGPKITEGKSATRLGSAHPIPKNDRKAVEFVSQMLSDAGVADLERLATALFVTLHPSTNPEDRISRLLELKPHVQPDEAKDSFHRLEEMLAMAGRSGFDTTLQDRFITSQSADCESRSSTRPFASGH